MTDSEKELSNQIQHYERFLNEVLRTKLRWCLKLIVLWVLLIILSTFLQSRECLNARETFITDIHDYLQLKKSLENFNEIDTEPLKTKVDLGCGFFVQSKV